MMQKILLTGGAGYIGTSLQKMLARGFSFVSFDVKENFRDTVLDLRRLMDKVRGVDGVLHLAAVSRPKWGFEDPHHCLTTNIVGTFNVLEAVRRVNPEAWVMLGSSREVFGNLAHFPGTEKSPRNPLNSYGVSKKTGEDLLKQYAENYGLRCLTLRFCGVYTGPHDILDRVIPKFIGQALRGEPLTIQGRGKSQRGDFVYIDDVLRGLTLALQYVSKKPKGFYDDINLVKNDPVSLRDLAQLIIKISKSQSRIIYLPARTYDQESFWASPAKAKKLLGWKPKLSLETGLRRSITELKPIAHKRGYRSDA